MQKFEGIYPALVTPLTADEKVNQAAVERLVERLYAAGVDGLYVGGSTGEGRDLSPERREQVLEAAVKASPAGKRVIAHVGAWRLEETLRLARHAEAAGASAISSLPPGPQYSFTETKDWYRRLGEASGLPLILYHFPALGVSFSLNQLEELLSLPRVAGVKFTSFDSYTLRELTRQGITMFNGHDEALAAGLLMKACGGIGSTYNLMPESFVSLYQSAITGNWDGALVWQDKVNAVIRVLVDFPFLPALKKVLSWQGYECGSTVAPRTALNEGQEAELRRRLTGLLF